MNAATPPAGAPEDAVTGIAFATRNVTAAEAAAVSAVLGAMLHEESDLARTVHDAAPSAWERSQRALRTPLTPGPGAWRGFAG